MSVPSATPQPAVRRHSLAMLRWAIGLVTGTALGIVLQRWLPDRLGQDIGLGIAIGIISSGGEPGARYAIDWREAAWSIPVFALLSALIGAGARLLLR